MSTMNRQLNKTKPANIAASRFLRWCKLPMLIMLLVTGAWTCAIGQDGSAKNAFYAEAASRGPVYSINYDRIFRQGDKLAYSFRAGFSMYSNTVSFPVGINFITGLNEHHAEFSLSVIPYIDYDVQVAGTDKKDSDKYIFINPAIGYRYQKTDRGIFIKAAVGPSIYLDPPSDDFWNMDPKVYGFGSIGLGISF